jgi:Phosphotransferase enzyme family
MSHPEKTRLLWLNPSWRHAAEEWIRERVTELGHRLAGRIEQSHVRAWGTVCRVRTDDGTLWFKASIPPLAYEMPLLDTLAVHAPDRVPRLLAADAACAWTLMEDAGTRLTDLHPDGAPVAIWTEFLPQYAQLQLDAAPAAGALVSLGVPDRRLPQLVDGFLRVLENDRLIRPATGGGLDAGELRRLLALTPQLTEAVDRVASLDLPDSVQHDDLHAWNVCVRDGGYRFIDWGDACIAHPLLSLSVPLAHVGDEGAAAIREAYLEPWTALRPHDQLAAASDAAVLLGQVTGVLKWELINSGLSDDERVGYEDVIAKRLRYLLELACA